MGMIPTPSRTQPKAICRVSKTMFENNLDMVLAAGLPIIITDLFSQSPISRFRTSDDVCRLNLNERVRVSREYRSSYQVSGNYFGQPTTSISLGTYLRDVRLADPQFVVTEQPTPDSLLSLLDIPDACTKNAGFDGVRSEIFVAPKGAHAYLHFDWDFRHVMLYQVFGEKRLIVSDPSAAERLRPLFNMSMAELASHDDVRFSQLFAGANWYTGTIHAGETAYVPPLMWHHLTYMSSAMSISLRFGRTRFGYLFQAHFPPSYLMQQLGWLEVIRPTVRRDLEQIYERVLVAYATADLCGLDLYRYIRNLLVGELEVLQLPIVRDQTVIALEEQQAAFGIDAGNLYCRDRSAKDMARLALLQD